jgi:hypothetical protein
MSTQAPCSKFLPLNVPVRKKAADTVSGKLQIIDPSVFAK